MDPLRPLSALAAVLVAAGGIWHAVLWQDRYRDLPSQIPGVSVVKVGFPINAVASIVIAVLLVLLVGRLIIILAALALQLGSIAALVDARTAVVLGWEDKVWDTPAVGVLALELVASALLVGLALLVVRRLNGREGAAVGTVPAL